MTDASFAKKQRADGARPRKAPSDRPGFRCLADYSDYVATWESLSFPPVRSLLCRRAFVSLVAHCINTVFSFLFFPYLFLFQTSFLPQPFSVPGGMPSDTHRRSRFGNFASKFAPHSDPQRRSSHSGSLLSPLDPNSPQSGSKENYYGRPSSPTYSDQLSSNNHGQPQEVSYRIDDDLVPPVAPFAPQADSALSSRRSSISFLADKDSLKNRASSLSLNYVPAKFTRLHAPGDYAHRRKQGGGRDAFASNAQRMGQVGTVDDDEGVIFQISESGLKRKKPKLRWNRFKWVLFLANSVVSVLGL